MIGNRMVTIENYFHMINQTFLLDKKVRHFQEIIVSRDTERTSMGRKEAIQVI